MTRASLLAAAVLALAGSASGAQELDLDLSSREGQVVAALAASAYASVPSPYNSLLFLERTQQPDFGFRNLQFGGGRPLSGSSGLFLEGYVSAQDYEPEFAFANAPEAGEDGVRWRSVAATLGAGWDFDLAPGLSLRPVANASLGRIVSNAEVPSGDEAEGDVDFIAGNGVTTGGYGGALLLEYRVRARTGDIDLRLRSSWMRLVPIGEDVGSGEQVDAATTAILARYREPIPGWNAWGGPVRQVYELTYAQYHGEQGDLLNLPWLARLGTGLEFETGWTRPYAPPRVRVMFRYIAGEDFGGFGIGAGLVY